METEEAFAFLFGGRGNAYGNGTTGLCIREDVTGEVWRGHLFGDKPIGIYPLRFEGIKWWVKWGCADFDEGYDASWPKARLLADALTAAGLYPWIERSRSKGYHVWLFAEGWVPASDMRRTLLAAFQVAELTPKEVNPKAEGGEDPGFLGNYVRLPYPHGATDRQVMLEPLVNVNGGPDVWPLEGFLSSALDSRASATDLARIAKLYKPPAPPKPVYWDQYDGEVEELLRERRAGLVRWRIENSADLDRSTFLFRLALACVEVGFDASQARAVVQYVDETQTFKYAGRRDADDQYTRIIERAYG